MRLIRNTLPALAAVALAGLLASSAVAQTELTGQTASGAFYRIAVPDGWTPASGLVIWNHGSDESPIGPVDDLGPLADVQLAEGYAVAASSFSLNGWSLFETLPNNRELVDVVHDNFGVPDQILIYGASIGGLVTAQAVEQGGLGNVVGAMPICGAVAGSRVWDGGLDLRLLYDYLCGNVPGAEIPGGAGGLPFPPDPALTEEALALRLNACTGVLVPPLLRTPQQSQRLNQLLQITGLPENFVLTDMAYATMGLFDLVYDPDKLNNGWALGNLDVDYGNQEVNAGIERVASNDRDRARLLANYTPTGKVGDIKIVSIHTDKDGLVLVENESEYASVVPPQNLTTAIVVEGVPTHCGFTEAETLAGWESLRGWVAGLAQPTVASIQATCQALVVGGLAQGPCRYDPNFVIPDLDERVRPRGNCVQDQDTLCLNENRFKVEIDWTDFQNNTGVGNTTPFNTNDSGSFWFFDPDNIEMIVKVLDARNINNKFWVFYGSLTNVAFTLTVTDTETGIEKVYNNPSGNFASVGDTDAF